MKKEVLQQTASLLIAAFGFVAALAWNEAIQSLFVEGGALEFMADSGPWAYAILVTLLAVIVTVWIAKLIKRAR